MSQIVERSGRFERREVGGEAYSVFIPKPLPVKPPISWNGTLQELSERANRAIGRLDGLAGILPDTGMFLYSYIRKEAVLSSQIEGTQSTLSDLLLFEFDPDANLPADDVREVSNYVAAMEHGLKRIHEGFPLSLRLIREIHAILLRNGRGAERTPGEFRTSQNWVGGTRPGNAHYVPPPPETLMEHLGALETFLHNQPERTPSLVKAGLAHVQFESIHPFLDGNGRVGRLLITLLLCAEDSLKEPLLYLSLFLKKNRDSYYEHLQAVRTAGAWEPWLEFYFKGVAETAEQASSTARRLLELFRDDHDRIQRTRRAGSVVQVHQALQQTVIGTVKELSLRTSLTQPTVASALDRLEDLGIVTTTDARKRGRFFRYDRFLHILAEGTEAE